MLIERKTNKEEEAMIPTRTVHRPERGVTWIEWDDGSKAEYSVRGGIAWPVAVEADVGRRVVGYAVIAGVNVATDRVTVFDHHEFNVVEASDKPRLVAFGPLALRWWSTYYALRYYWRQEAETAWTFRTSIHRSPSILPKPTFTAINWDNEAAAESVIWQTVADNRLSVDKELLEMFKLYDGKPWSPPKHALLCCLVGMQRYPWHEPVGRD